MYSQAPLKHRKLLITFVIIGPRVDRGASINQDVSPRALPVFFHPSKTIKTPAMRAEAGKGAEKRKGASARSVPEINCSYNSPYLSEFRKYYIGHPRDRKSEERNQHRERGAGPIGRG